MPCFFARIRPLACCLFVALSMACGTSNGGGNKPGGDVQFERPDSLLQDVDTDLLSPLDILDDGAASDHTGDGPGLDSAIDMTETDADTIDGVEDVFVVPDMLSDWGVDSGPEVTTPDLVPDSLVDTVDATTGPQDVVDTSEPDLGPVCGPSDPLACGPMCVVCGGWTPQCYNGECILCNFDYACGSTCKSCIAPKPACKPDGLGCVECTTNAHCSGNNKCSPEYKCVKCVVDGDCLGGSKCNDSNVCVQCIVDGDCINGFKCNASSVCVECLSDLDCDGGFKCNEASVCVECLTDSDCSGGYKCNSGQVCVQCLSTPDCGAGAWCNPATSACEVDTPLEGCTEDLSNNAYTCSKAKIIGRKVVTGVFKSYSGVFAMNSTNDDDVSGCDDISDEEFYRIYLGAGHVMDIELQTFSSSYDPVIKIYSGTDCDNNGSGDLSICSDAKSGATAETHQFTAPSNGWYSIVADGNFYSGGFEELTSYTLKVKVTCNPPTCGCQ